MIRFNIDGIMNEIVEERLRQQSEEGWTTDHDDGHTDGQMARAASAYAYFAALPDKVREVDQIQPMHQYDDFVKTNIEVVRRSWPWDWSWWKPKDRRRDLIRAAALIVAEIERLDRGTSTRGR